MAAMVFSFLSFFFFPWCWYFISLCTLGHEFVWNGLQQLRLFSVSPHKVCFSGWRRLALLVVLLRRFRKLSLLFGCLMCSIRTLILLARTSPFTCLLTMMTPACWVTL